MRLQGKVAVITGGNSGIGLAVARAFRGEGASVAIFGRDGETLSRAALGLGDEALAVRGDVASPADLDRLFDRVADRFGGVDVLVASAGIYERTPLEETDADAFDRTAATNFKGVFFTVQRALPHLRRGASVILVTSTVHEAGVPGLSVYSATKAAVRSLARTLAAELLPRGVRVNALSPGVIETPIFGRLGLPEEERQNMLASMRGLIPMGRLGDPAEVASAALFLASEDSSYVVGTELVVSGGLGQL